MTRYEQIHEYEPSLNGSALCIGIVMSRFNPEVGEGLLAACMQGLRQLGVSPEQIHLAKVAGALEIPLVLQHMAQSSQFDALIALGAVIRGETYHFELVSNEVARGISQVGLENAIPIANGVLTTENDDQALARTDEKGRDCAHVAVEMANLLQALP